MYEYNATLKRVVDGDTVWLRVDLGFRTFVETSFRLEGIDCAELISHDEEQRIAANAAKDFLELQIKGWQLRVRSLGLDKYGRWLGRIYLPDGRDVNQMMIDSKHAVAYSI